MRPEQREALIELRADPRVVGWQRTRIHRGLSQGLSQQTAARWIGSLNLQVRGAMPTKSSQAALLDADPITR